MSVATAPGLIRTKIPARLDRLPWSRFHWRIVLGLGTVWILDGLEVTIVGTVASRLTSHGSGIAISVAEIGYAASAYVLGACLGAIFFGYLTDRFGRRRLFMITLGIYIACTAATGASFEWWYFLLFRFLTGSGIGGEYASINSAIDELIPARARGTVDLSINGSYWGGSIAGSALSLLLLDEALLPADVGWRLCFGMGVLLGLLVLLVRRNVPESPRWLFLHGREEEAERIVDGIEHEVLESTGQQLSRVTRTLTVQPRERTPITEIIRTAFGSYPTRAFLALALFVGQAFIYNGITFDIGTLLGTFFGVASGMVPIFTIVYGASNLAGPLTIGRLFDTVGRRPMISGTYLGSAVLGALLAALFMERGTLNAWTFMVVLMASFFLASAGASAAYLTASEIFPMEMRALAIAVFYAVGTGLGGIIGPSLFAGFINSGSRTLVGVAFLIGAGVMALGGVVELFFGVKAEGAQLEDIATPMTAVGEAGASTAGPRAGTHGTGTEGAGDAEPSPGKRSPEETEEWEGETGQREPATDEREPATDERGRATEEQTEARPPAGEEALLLAAEEAERRETEERVRQRIEARRFAEARGLRRYRPGPSRGQALRSFSFPAPLPEEALDDQVRAVESALAEHGPMDRGELARMVGARYWGPGAFGAALRQALLDGHVERLSRSIYGPADQGRRERPS